MEIVLPSEAPIQSLMDYVFENYCELDEFCEIEEETKDTTECVKCHRESYFSGGNPIYECDNFKRLYLVRYLARQFEQSDLLIRTHILHDIESKPNLSAVSLGGGPAPEVIALMNELHICGENYNVSFDNIDCEASWEPIYHDLAYRFAKRVKNVKLKTGFSASDVTSHVSAKQYDIVFISWLLSDMGGQDSSNVLEVAKNLATPLGYILIMDRDESPLIAKISALVNETRGLMLLEHDSRYVHSIVNFPPDITDTFAPDFGCDFAYWVLQSSPNDF